jgi:3-hydroxybutyryl-CoA dehydrogenase
MKVIVIATGELKEEVLAHAISEKIQLEWLDSPGKLLQVGAMDACIDLLFDNTRERKDLLAASKASLIIVSSVTPTLGDLSPGMVRLNGWPTFLKRDTWEAVAGNQDVKNAAEDIFKALGRKTEWTPDIPGFITPRVISSVINEAFWALEEEISTETEIDTAMKMGTNYPYGPFEWGQKIGLQHICTLLEALSIEQNHYKPCPLLKERTLV